MKKKNRMKLQGPVFTHILILRIRIFLEFFLRFCKPVDGTFMYQIREFVTHSGNQSECLGVFPIILKGF